MTRPPATRSLEETADLLVLTSARLSRLYNRVLSRLEVPLTYRQHRLLVRVGQGHSSVAVLATFGNLTMPTVSESISVLVRRGFVTRRENPDDRRLTLIEFTPLGREASKAAQEALEEASTGLLRDLPEDVHEVFHQALTTVYDKATRYSQHEVEDAGAPPGRPDLVPAAAGKRSPRSAGGTAAECGSDRESRRLFQADE
jgi:DNA-binding MarR family transcriptional regulator